MKLSDYVIDCIARQGVSHIFEFIGGAITHLIDSTVDRDDIQCISVHHEQSGAFAAEAYARINGRLGVAMATSGPGALNLVTGIGSCFFDSVPCLFITGQVNTYEYKFDKPVRQIGFQETDIVSVVQPLTKYAVLVIDPETIRYHLEKAIFLAQSGRPGPVLLDIPMDVQRARVSPEKLRPFLGSPEHQSLLPPAEDPRCIAQVSARMAAAKRPVILVGGGVRTSGATSELVALVAKTGIPVVTTLMGLDAIPHDNPAFFGMIGAYGNRYSNLTLANSDFLLILGARLDSRQTGTRPETFGRAAFKVHVDIDPNELQAKVAVDLALTSDIRMFLTSLNNCLAGDRQDLSGWYRVINGYRERYPTRSTDGEIAGIEPNEFMAQLAEVCAPGDAICLDVGQNQMWAAQSFSLKDEQRMLISGGMGAMGFALPAAMGAAFAGTGQHCVAIAGDGGIQVNIQDLATVAQYGLPIKIVVMNNGCLGMVRQFQDMYFGGRRQSTLVGYDCPDLMAIARAYGIPAFTVAQPDAVPERLREFMTTDGPAFLNVSLATATCVNPKLVVNRPIEDMSPHLSRADLASEMLIELEDEGEVPK